MAHRIEEMDVTQGVELHWHRLNEVAEKITRENIVLNRYDVEPVKVFAGDVETGHVILRCTDNGAFLGDPYNPETYKPVSNKDFLKMVFDFVSGTGHEIVSAGSLCNRMKVFISVKLKENGKYNAAGREFHAFANIWNGFGKMLRIGANTSNTCVVCHNTLTFNVGQEGCHFEKHTKNVEAKLSGIGKFLDEACGVQAEFKAAMDTLAKKKTDEETARRVFTGFLTTDGNLKQAKRLSDAFSTRSQNIAGRLVELFKDGKGNRGRDFSDILSAATDYYTHESAGGEDLRKQYESSEIGSGASRKSDFFAMVTSDEKREAAIERGAKVLELPVF